MRRFGLWAMVVLFFGVWSIVAWETLLPPIVVPTEDVGLDDMVSCEGGVLGTDGFFGGISVDAFYIDRFEVTYEDYSAFLKAVPTHPIPRDSRWNDRRIPDPTVSDWPVTHVSLEDARSYAAWRRKRIPTAAEWEWAARGRGSRRFPWGDHEPASILANTLELGHRSPTPVGLFESGKSPFGVYDMIGNVEEWTVTTSESGALADRYFVRGGSFADRIFDWDTKTTAMETHRYQVDQQLAVPRSEKLHGARSYAHDRGFRCVRTASSAKAEIELKAAISALGARSPIAWWKVTRPAMQHIRREGAAAIPILRAAAEKVDSAAIRERVLGLASEIQEKNP